eukprot:g11074.t1
MTAGKLLHPATDEHVELNTDCSSSDRPWSPPIKPAAQATVPTSSARRSSSARKRPRTSSLVASSSTVLPPYPPQGSNKYGIGGAAPSAADELGRTRPRSSNNPTQFRPGKRAASEADSFRQTELPCLGDGRDGGWSTLSPGFAESSSSNSSARLSKSAKVLEEDRKKVASIRSFLLNFLEERDCSIKKRLDLYVHQTETGRPVTDAVVQEVCKLRPDMIGLSLRDCIEVTDVGLWCIARHTTALRELNISGCHGVTNIGLRSLAICCDKMEQLDFTSCTRLTDLGLRVLGGGCWSLKSLSLEGCSHVSDTGVAELAKMCTGLTYLNISRCERVGEYGDRALIQLGRSCHQLKGLDAFGCSHAQDPGLLAVAHGCPKLEKLMLTGCGGITGKSVRALARGCSALRDLSLSGCGGVGNGDLKELAKGCTNLRHLNIAECKTPKIQKSTHAQQTNAHDLVVLEEVNAHGLAALAGGLKNLTELDVGGCERVDDAALRALCSMNAHFLNLSGCAAITEAGVAGIAMNCTALSSLNVTGCPGIGRRFMAELCHSMKLSEPAQAYFGFQPRKNAKELLAMKELRNRRMVAAIVVQAHMRGRLARGRASIVRRNWIVKTRLARTQAIIRGYFARKWYRNWRAQGPGANAGDKGNTGKATAARGPSSGTSDCDRYCNDGAAASGEAGENCQDISARRELAAITIQSNLRRVFAQKQLLELRRLRDEAVALEKRNQAAAVLIQSLARMQEGRAALAVLKARRDRKILEWEMALRVQAAWRGRAAKMVVMTMRLLREEARQKAAAITIQSFWRAVRARHLTTIQRAMFKIRQIQAGASKGEQIQRVYRGFKGRLRAKARRRVFESDLGREAAAMAIGRIFRGHKGRERFECKQHLRSLEDKARPLLLKLDELIANAAKLSERARFLQMTAEPLRTEHTTIREELFHIRHTTDKYTDSDKVNGCRQRFLTKFLQVRLVELKRTVEGRLEKLDAEAIEVEVKERHNTRILRQTERELIPLGKGTVEKVKLLRTARLRKKVRSERRGASIIQRVFRGWRVRKAINSWYRDYWVESEDAATGDVYYVNTWNQELRWTKPLEMSLFESSSGKPGTGTSSRLSDGDGDDDDVDGSGIETISGRFRQRLVELTGEATLAAEEEEGFLRYVAANMATLAAPGDSSTNGSSSNTTTTTNNNNDDNKTGTNNSDNHTNSTGGGSGIGGGGIKPEQGGENHTSREALALAAAREWRFVSTDSRFQSPSPGAANNHYSKKIKCWYRAESSEYFWGDHPPLLGLLPGLNSAAHLVHHKPLPQTSGSGDSDHHRVGRGHPFEAVDATVGIAGRGVSSDGGEAGKIGTVQFQVHPRFGLVFADRAAGETWLRAQDAGALLATSKKVCDVGPAGWRQLRAPGERGGGRDEDDDADPAGSIGLTAADASSSGAVSTMTENSGSAADAGAPANATATVGAEPVEENETASRDVPPSLPPFTFFHHAETGDLRWCLSPRSALRTPRTPRREAYHTAATVKDAAASAEDSQQLGWDGGGAEAPNGVFCDSSGAVPTADEDDGVLVLASSNSSDSWEVVEDGDVVFYYNRKLGVSSWEPPPGWGESASIEQSYGDGG